jgi:acetamidase/formamidase
MDTRDLSVGTQLLLPVEVPGALFSVGAGHAAQGDGEVCGTAIECPMEITLKLDLIKGAKLNFPRFRTSGPLTVILTPWLRNDHGHSART